MRLRLFARRIIPIAAVIAAVRCANDFTPPSDLLPAYINMLAGDQQAGIVGQRVSDTLVVRVTDLRDQPVKDQKVLFKLIAGGSGSALIPDTAVTDADGQAKSVWVLGHIAGQQAVEARVLADGPSGGLRQLFYGQAAADVPDTVFAIRGQNQQGIVATALVDSLIVVVGDQFGNPIPGQTVNWTVPSGQGTVSASTTTTGADGRSAVLRILGPTAGNQTATATWTALPGSPVVFSHVAGASGVSALVKVFGDNQTAPAGLPLTDSIVVRAQDASGNGVSGRSVLWVVSGGGGSISSGSTTTDAQGKTFVRWTLGTVAGPNTVTAAITGLPPVTFNATGTATQPTRIQAASPTSLTAPNSTPVFPPPSVRVNDANNNGVQGVTITFQVTAGGGTVSDGVGSGSVVTVATGANGTATLTNWVLGPTAGTNNNSVTATAAGANITGNPVSFTASATAGQPARLAFAQQPTNTGAGVVIAPSVTVQVQDLGGNLVATATNPITLNFDANPGGGTLNGTKTVNAIGGVATFNDLTVNQTGTGYTLAASAPGLAPATSNTFNITAGPAVKLGFVVQPSNPGAGQPMTPPVQVAVQDQFGNTVPTATTSITVAFGNNPTGATLAGTKTVNAVAGVATFPGLSVNLTGVGYTLVTTGGGFTSATSAAFNIGFGAATKLAFIQQPSSVQAGAAIQPEVQVAIQDVNGNTVATANDSVFLVIGNNPSGSTLNGGRVQAAAGVAHFNALVLNLAGNGYTLVTSSGTLTGATSNGFNVTSSSGVRLAFGQQPTTVSAGTSITPAVTVRMLDIQGNVVTNFVGPITVAFGSNPTGGVLGGTLTQNAVAGVATFNDLSVNKVGIAYSLVATNQGVITAVSNDFNVIPGPAAALQWVDQPPTIVPAVAGQPISPPVSVRVIDAGGNQVAGSTASITISIFTNPGGSTLTGTVTVNAAGGLATFSNLVLNKAGTGYVLRASSGALTPGNSVAFNVRANNATRVVFAQEPTNAVAGAVISPTVTVRVEDNFGNLADINGNVSLSLVNNPGGAVFPSGSSSAIPQSGIASFPSISLDKTGTGYTIRAGVTGLIPDTSAAFNVTPGAANKLVFGVQPSNAVAGVAIAPAITVRVLDVNDNLVSSTAPVTLTVSTNPGGATLTGGGPINAVAGTATFPALSLNRSGVGYVLTATSGSLTATTSTGFNITHGAASALVWTVQPTNGTAGSALAPTPQVTVRDNQGNTVTGFAGTITVTIGNNPGAATLSGGTPSNMSNGVADFAFLSLNRPGNGYTLIASAGGVPPNVTSAAFNIQTGAGNQLVYLVQPSNDTVGKPMTPAVRVAIQDAQGNTVTTATNSVTLLLVLNPGGATLTGNVVSAVAGIATFNNLRLDRASIDPYNMIATASALISSPNSSLFTIVKAPTTTTVTADSPDPSLVGQPYTVSFTTVATAPASGTPTGSVTVSDGVSSCVGTLTAGAGSCSLTSTTVGAKTLTGTYGNDANYVHGTSVTAPHTVNVAATTTTITADTPDPSTVGSAYTVNFTVAAVAPGAGTPTGTVTVSDGTGATCAPATLSGGVGTCQLTSTTPGAKTLTATYATDGNFAGSASPGVPHTVNTAGTVTSVVSSVNPSTFGQSVTFTATVTSALGTPTGNVQFVVDGVNFGASVALAGGVANSAATTTLAAGNHTVTANYLGAGNFAASSGSLAAGQTVNTAGTVTSVVSSVNPSTFGQSVSFTATVTSGAGTPTGSVQFVVDGVNFGAAVALTGGVATSAATTTLAAGNRTVTANYLGAGNFAASSGALAGGQTVNPAATGTSVSSSVNPSTFGQSVTFTATVTSGAGTPTGSVQFVVDGVNFGAAVALTGGAATSAATTTLAAGNHTVTANYLGAGNFAASSGALAGGQTVNPAATGTTVISSVNPSIVGQAVSFTATVTSGAGTPTGSVQFVVDGVNFGAAVALAGGQATSAATTTLTAGNHTVTANYLGAGNFAASSGALAGGQTVN